MQLFITIHVNVNSHSRSKILEILLLASFQLPGYNMNKKQFLMDKSSRSEVLCSTGLFKDLQN